VQFPGLVIRFIPLTKSALLPGCMSLHVFSSSSSSSSSSNSNSRAPLVCVYSAQPCRLHAALKVKDTMPLLMPSNTVCLADLKTEARCTALVPCCWDGCTKFVPYRGQVGKANPPRTSALCLTCRNLISNTTQQTNWGTLLNTHCVNTVLHCLPYLG